MEIGAQMICNKDTKSDFAMGDRTTPQKLARGSRFAGRYDIDTMLGEGGMGAVYRVRDQALAEVVALKVLSLPVSGAHRYAEMFRQEVRLSRRITHANVVHVYDIGEVDGLLYMTMELIDGMTLRDAIFRAAAGRLPFGEAIQMGYSLAKGLAAVHAHGIVHRDLKPSNVMIAHSGRVVLADFGVASQVDVENPALRGGLVGTIGYMAPEQFAKQPPSPRTDIYSFGLVLLECLTGALPKRGDSWLSCNREPIHVDLAAAGVAGDASRIAAAEQMIRRCLESDPRARPSSAEELSHAMNALVSPEHLRIDIGTHSVERTNTSVSQGLRVPTWQLPEVAVDRTTVEVSDLMAQGIAEDIAREYVAGRHDVRLNDATHIVNAFERFDACVNKAPHFLAAIASRAVAANRCWFFDRNGSCDVNWEEVASECVAIAIKEAWELSDTHLALGMLSTQRFEMKHAVRALVRSLEINPMSHEAQEYLGGIEIETGLVDRGMPRVVYAATAIPLRPMPCQIQARCHALFGRFDEAEALLAEANRRSSVPTLGGISYALRVHAYRRGRSPASLSIAQRKAVRENNWVPVVRYVEALAGNGDAHDVSRWMDNFIPLVQNLRARMVLRQVCVEIAMLMGLEAKAIELLADCARNGLIDILWFDRCPLLEPLRGTNEMRPIRDWVWLNAYGVWN